MVHRYLAEAKTRFEEAAEGYKAQVISPNVTNVQRETIIQGAQEAAYKAELLGDILNLPFNVFFEEAAEEHEEEEA